VEDRACQPWRLFYGTALGAEAKARERGRVQGKSDKRAVEDE
jgi:hypothetical protein